MSRLGKTPVAVPDKVEVTIVGTDFCAKGPKGQLTQSFGSAVRVEYDATKRQITVAADGDDRQTRANHGLYRSLIKNIVVGVSQGYQKKLQVEGVGFRVAQAGNKLVFSVGFCHPVEYLVPPAVTATLDGTTKIILDGIDKQLLGQVAADIRGIKPPEPYKGKGIRYADEVVRRKVGKAMAK